MSDNPQQIIFQSILQDREKELEFYLNNMSEDHLEILKKAQPHQIQYYLDIKNEIENKHQLKKESPQIQDAKVQNTDVVGQYQEGGIDGDEELEEGEEQQENETEEDQPEALTRDGDQVNQFTQEVKKEIITNQNGQDIFKILYSNGDCYEGEMDDDLKGGSGVYYYQNGEKFDGLFQDDMLHGYGVYHFLGGHVYEGDWYMGQKHGFGILVFGSGDKYQGQFVDDNFQGKGTFIHKNGDQFDGEWKKGKKNGFGKFFGKDGRRIYGEWVNDDLQHF